jgi:hypothetical protein
MPSEYLLLTAGSLVGLGMVTMAMLKGWQDWISFKTREMDLRRPELEGGNPAGMARIEIADLKERIRKLEAIAAGVDL